MSNMAEVGSSCAQIMRHVWIDGADVDEDGFLCRQCSRILCAIEQARLKMDDKISDFEGRAQRPLTRRTQRQDHEDAQEDEQEDEEDHEQKQTHTSVEVKVI